MSTTKRIVLNLPVELHAVIKSEARDMERTFTGQMLYILKTFCATKSPTPASSAGVTCSAMDVPVIDTSIPSWVQPSHTDEPDEPDWSVLDEG